MTIDSVQTSYYDPIFFTHQASFWHDVCFLTFFYNDDYTRIHSTFHGFLFVRYYTLIFYISKDIRQNFLYSV